MKITKRMLKSTGVERVIFKAKEHRRGSWQSYSANAVGVASTSQTEDVPMEDKVRIVVADADERTCKILKLIFERKGYETEVVRTGSEAIKKAKKWKNKYSPASEITDAELYCSVDVE